MRIRSILTTLFVVALFAGSAIAQSANVWVVHGINGTDLNGPRSFPVDVAVNGQCTLENFKFGKIAGPLTLAPGTYRVAVSPANLQNPCSNPPAIAAPVPIAAGEDVVIIAHLDAQGNPTASKFLLNLKRPRFLRGRLIAHHTAAAPAVDIRLRGLFWLRNRRAAFEGVTNGQQGAIDLPIGLYRTGVFPAGSQTPVLGPLPAPILPRTAIVVFVVGSLQNNTLQPLVFPFRTRR